MSTGKYRKERNCLNCGFHVEEHYCSSCGQPNLELKESFWQFVSHSVAHYFHFDNKFFQTLVPLLTKPGQVTLDYLAGKRARYINPISMYIFVSIVYFLVVFSPTKKQKEQLSDEKVFAENTKAQRQLLDSIPNPLTKGGIKDQSIIGTAQQKIKEGLDRSTFKKLSFKLQDSILQTLKADNQLQKNDSLARIISRFEEIHQLRNDSTYAAYLDRQKTLPLFERDNWFERMIKKRSIEIGQNAELITEQLAHNRPKQYFLLMPLMALFIMLNFRKNHINYLDHLIFTIHGMTAFFLVSIFTQPLIKYIFGTDAILSSIVNLAVIAWICWYMFNAIKVFYQRKNGVIIARMIWILILYGISVKLTEMVLINIIYYVAI